jgi:hypothetical protein
MLAKLKLKKTNADSNGKMKPKPNMCIILSVDIKTFTLNKIINLNRLIEFINEDKISLSGWGFFDMILFRSCLFGY